MSKIRLTVSIVVVLLLGLALGASLTAPFGCGSTYGYGYGGMMGPWMMGGFGIAGLLLGGLFLVLVAAGVVWVVQASGRTAGTGTSPSPSESPLDILKRRYAKGEITKDQYEAMKRDLDI